MFWQIKGANVVTSHNLHHLPKGVIAVDLLVKVKSSFIPECLASFAFNETMP